MVFQRHIVAAFLALSIVLALLSRTHAETFEKVPEKLQAALFIKILAMSKEISNGKDLSIYVVNAPQAAVELRKAVGRKIGKSVLAVVKEGSQTPSDPPAILYIGNNSNVDELIGYCRENRVLSLTGTPELVEKGVTLGVCISGDKPKILLNVTATKAERITWNPTLLKISKIYK